MSELVPNLAELVEALPPASDGLELAAAFDTSRVDEARSALRAVVATWEQPPQHEAPAASSDETPPEDQDLFGGPG